jgi:hypothetical protein
MAAAVSTADGFTVVSTKALFRHSSLGTTTATNFDVSPDGERFLVVETLGDEADGAPAIHVIENWYEEFRGRETN